MAEFFAVLFSTELVIAFLTLAALEIVLGIDNIVFISIVTGRLDPAVQSRARKIGLLGAMGMRIALLFGVSLVMASTAPLFTLFDHGVSLKDLILLIGGLFLLAKATFEIHHKLEEPGHTDNSGAGRQAASFSGAIAYIMAIDLIFSLDSVITAVGMVQPPDETNTAKAAALTVMVSGVVAAVIVMMIFADPVARFIEKHPTMKMLALSFLILIGVLLVTEAFHHPIPRGYVYFAMAFSLAVELMNIRVRAKRRPVKLNLPHPPDGPASSDAP